MLRIKKRRATEPKQARSVSAKPNAVVFNACFSISGGDVCAQLAILLELPFICFYMRPTSELPAFPAVNDRWDPVPLPGSRLSFTPSAVPKPMRSHPSPHPVVPGDLMLLLL